MLEFEFEKPETSVCDCCGKTTTRLIRWVIQNDEAFAMYYAAFSDGHSESGVIGVVSFGEWWVDGYIPEARVAIAFQMWEGDGEYKVVITDASESPWANAKLIGRKLSREQALESEWTKDLFHITDHMVSADPAIRRFFETVH